MNPTLITQATHRSADHFQSAKAGKPSQHDQLVAQAEKWVATSFYGELLKQAHSSPFKSKLFSGGRGGEVFGAMQDQQLAAQMTRGAGRKLVNAIVNKIEANQAYGRHQGAMQGNPAMAVPGGSTHSAAASIISNGRANGIAVH